MTDSNRSTDEPVIQRDFFRPLSLELKLLLRVNKKEKFFGLKKYQPLKGEKKALFLAVVNDPIQKKIYLYTVKVPLKRIPDSSVKSKSALSKPKCRATLNDIQLIDGVADSLEITLLKDKQIDVLKYIPITRSARDVFLTEFVILVEDMKAKNSAIRIPQFIRVPESVLNKHNDQMIRIDEFNAFLKEDESSAKLDDTSHVQQIISEYEISCLDNFFNKSPNYAITDAEKIAVGLVQQLEQLDDANFHQIMQSEDDINSLIRIIDDGVKEATSIEAKLNKYHSALEGVESQMTVMQSKSQIIEMQSSNTHLLKDTLAEFIYNLTEICTEEHLTNLDRPNLYSSDFESDLQVIKACETATAALKECLDILDLKEQPSLNSLSAAASRRSFYKSKEKAFGKYFYAIMCKLLEYRCIQHRENQYAFTLSVDSNVRLPNHRQLHSLLLPFSNLMRWFADSSGSEFDILVCTYQNFTKSSYDSEMSMFLEHTFNTLSTSTSRKRTSKSTFHTTSVGNLTDTGSILSDLSIQSGNSFAQISFGEFFTEILNACAAEFKFISSFFYLTKNDGIDIKLEETNTLCSEIFASWGETELSKSTFRKDERDRYPYQADGPSVLNFVEACYKLNPAISMHLFVSSTRCIEANNTNTLFCSFYFVKKLFSLISVRSKQLFNEYVAQFIKDLQSENSGSRKDGVLKLVQDIDIFFETSLEIFKDSSRYCDLEKALVSVIKTALETIPSLAVGESGKRNVVLFENYHQLYHILSKHHVKALDYQRRETKKLKEDHVEKYAKYYLSKPLEKLLRFVEDIESTISTSGVNPEDISYQITFSREELRKLIKNNSGKEVKSKLEDVYRKVEKHLSRGVGLHTVVWFKMQEIFFQQYNKIVSTVKRCYGENEKLEFTLVDLTTYFTEISKT